MFFAGKLFCQWAHWFVTRAWIGLVVVVRFYSNWMDKNDLVVSFSRFFGSSSKNVFLF